MVNKLVVSACEGCNKVKGVICVAYKEPVKMHRLFPCNLQSNNIIADGVKEKKFVNPLKASKRKGR
jgi:hypothetical protein